jgi:PPOX class probable F420-dependent enzyme
VARLATITPDGRPHVVPITFAIVGDTIVSAVDAKPKRTTALQRLANIAAHEDVSVLVDDYAEDWTALWWARADGRARIADNAERPAAVGALGERYEQYGRQPPTGPVIVIDVTRWSGWSAAETSATDEA